MKHPNGFGSVYKMPGARRNPWIARVTVGWEIATATKGKRKGREIQRQKYQTIGYYPTRKEALAALSKHHGSPASSRYNITLGQLYKEWSTSKYEKVSRATADSYIYSWPYLKRYENRKVRELRTADWQVIIDEAFDQGLSQSKITKIRTLASLLCNDAMKDDIVGKNYARLVDMPRFEKEERERFTDLEVRRIEAAAQAGMLFADTVLGLNYTGFRISEYMDLTRFNVDLKNNIIIGGGKSDAGKDRPIPIHPKILKYVRRWYNAGGERLICKDGKPISPRYYREKLYMPVLKAIGVRPLLPHTCRHTFCSMLADAGVDPLYIQRLAGHAQYAFTADEYTHPDFDRLREAMNRI